MVDEVYTSGETIEIAKEKACDMLGVTEKDLEIEILQMPSKKLLGMFGTTWLCESTFANANFMKPRYRTSISDENLALVSELRNVCLV